VRSPVFSLTSLWDDLIVDLVKVIFRALQRISESMGTDCSHLPGCEHLKADNFVEKWEISTRASPSETCKHYMYDADLIVINEFSWNY
jgi:hypothetical protein